MKSALDKRNFISLVNIFAGSILLAAGFVIFMTPYKVIPGGVYGLGIIMHQFFPEIQVGTFGLLFDIPLMLIGLRIFGRAFGVKTIFAALLVPVLMNTMTYFIGDNPASMFGGHADLSDDMFLVCIFGGVLIGAGMGLIIRTHATSGGTDIIAMIISKYTKLSFSQGVLIADSVIVIFGMLVLKDWRLPLYSLVTIFVSTRVIDFVVDGANYDKLLFIISEKQSEIRSFILDDMGRGGTYIKTSGMYTGADKEMIFLVVSRNEVSRVRAKIKEIDRNAFMVVVNAHETYGEGFKPFSDKDF